MATPWLDGKSNIFGKVVKGAAIVHTIEKVRKGFSSCDREYNVMMICLFALLGKNGLRLCAEAVHRDFEMFG